MEVVGTDKTPETAKKIKEQSPESSLPELHLTKLLRSEKPIDTIIRVGKEDKKSKIEQILPWKNYTILNLEEDDEIRIFDEEAKPVKGLESPKGKIFGVYWDNKIKNKIEKGDEKIDSICQDRYNSSESRRISELPLELRNFAKMALGRIYNLDIYRLEDVRSRASKITVLDKYTNRQ